MFSKIILFLCSLICIFSLKIDACSTFLLEKEHRFLLAKSYDWIVEDGLVVVNKRHIAKQAMTSDQPMQWVHAVQESHALLHVVCTSAPRSENVCIRTFSPAARAASASALTRPW